MNTSRHPLTGGLLVACCLNPRSSSPVRLRQREKERRKTEAKLVRARSLRATKAEAFWEFWGEAQREIKGRKRERAIAGKGITIGHVSARNCSVREGESEVLGLEDCRCYGPPSAFCGMAQWSWRLAFSEIFSLPSLNSYTSTRASLNPKPISSQSFFISSGSNVEDQSPCLNTRSPMSWACPYVHI
jgi:hypothetical protein